jgi:hypothetical protein
MEVSGQLHAPAALPFGGRAPSTHWIGGWVGPRAGLDTGEENSLALAGIRTPAVQPVARRYTDRAIPTPYFEACEIRRYIVWGKMQSILMLTQVTGIVITALKG